MSMKTDEVGKTIGKPFKRKLVIIAVAILFIITAAVFALNTAKSSAAEGDSQMQSTAAVIKGDLSLAISGSAPISSSTKFNFTSNVNGTLTKIYYEDGDKVKAGDLIFEIDDKDAQLKIKQLKNSIAQAKLSHENNLKDLNASTVTAPISGEIVDIQVKEGDNLSNNSTLLTITDKSKLKLLATFTNGYRSKLKIDQEVSVNAYDTTKEEIHNTTGVVSSISTPSYRTSDGAEVYNVGVTITNNSSLTEDMVANISVNIDGNTLTSKGNSELRYMKSISVKSESGGRLSNLLVENGQNVNKGDTLAELDNDDLKLTVETNSLKLEDYAQQLETAEEQLLDYKIYAPFDGTVTLTDNLEQGNSIKQGEVLGSVANYDTMEFSIDVDELDISKIQVGQAANVTIDAIEETETNPLKGTVTKIAVEGNSSDGVSTYPVTIQLDKNDSLKGSMNANAEIVVSEKKDVLYVPVDAVQKKNGKSFVMVVTDDGGKAGAARNTEKREVTTGISTEDYIEIVSGLSEGEKVIVTSSTATGNQMMPGGMPGGMGGPPPDGGGNSSQKNN
ncbi:MAG: efflux RND transporter periplasmic adaptor subunit [Pseudomonadota bacterium]